MDPSMSDDEEMNRNGYFFHNYRARKAWEHKSWPKLAVLLAGLLCVALLSSMIGLYAKSTAERNQCELGYSGLKTETEELQTNLTKERDLLNDQHNELKLLHSQLQLTYNITDRVNDHLLLRLCKLEMKVKENAVDISLDPDTAGPLLILSADGKRVWLGDSQLRRPSSSKRFDVPIVLGKQGFSTGRFYFEVLVKGVTSWYLGVTRESSNRKGSIIPRPQIGHWTIRQNAQKEFLALADNRVTFNPLSRVERVGVFVDYEAGEVSFYNAGMWVWDLLYSFNHVHFNDTIYPFFCAQAKSPLIITTPVSCYEDF
ncbi:erythroid membrane-associated protein-like isoform X1 [Alosa pseudoharengus]|uniref:erythroid membrane-associated protein-like isoform X1 n=1 Tax=Alosa pseudoharengus TaxID=34774 RepID=UPI003F8880C2